MLKDEQKAAKLAGLARFSPSRPCRYGHQERYAITGLCVVCTKERNKRGYSKHKARNDARSAQWRKDNPLRARAISRESKRRLDGLPEPTRTEPATCECCGKPPASGRALILDHCHKTDEFRGWLCFMCNTGIGKLGDCSTGVKKALAYLARFEAMNDKAKGDLR